MGLRDVGEIQACNHAVYAQRLFDKTASLIKEQFNMSIEAPTVQRVVDSIQSLGLNNLSLIECVYHWVCVLHPRPQ